MAPKIKTSRNEKAKGILIERWQQILRMLQEMPKHERKKHLDMRIWAEKTDCGTVGCVAGHAGLDAWFRKRGFKLIWRKLEGTWWPSFPVGDAYFFGYAGHTDVFMATQSTYSEVVRLTKSHIKLLEKLDPNDEEFDVYKSGWRQAA